jgi:non-homologous end joining protein Ku
MKTIKNTVLTCGLMTIPVSICKATEADESLDRAAPSGATVIRKEYDSATGAEITGDDCIYGVRQGDVFKKLVDMSVLKSIKESTKVDGIQVHDYINYEDIDIRRINGAYYLRPIMGEKGNPFGLKAFTLALIKTDKVAVAKYMAVSRQHLAYIYPEDDGSIIMNTVAFANQWRNSDHDCVAHMEVDIPATLVDRAVELIEVTESTDLVNSAQDDYISKTKELILKAIDGEELDFAEPEISATTDADKILEALEASIAAAKTGGDS